MSDLLAEIYRSTPVHDPLTQGDILAGVKCVDARSPTGVLRTVLVMSHSCEIDKPSAETCYAAVVHLFTAKERARSPHVIEAHRTGNVANAFYLPPSDSLGGEGFADFRSMYRIPYASIGAEGWEADPNGKDRHRLLDGTISRLVGLSREARIALGIRIGAFFARPDLG